ncbi:MAG TPA: TonB-dependent receptor [Candidatus Saccharimonadales bacterium]|nr:TonB-dependent receptor [Candidatus Saccharimonadales bacterium]
MQARKPDNPLLWSILLVLFLTYSPTALSQTPTATLHGRVVDAHTGEAIAKVKVIVSNSDQSTTTDENGQFTIENLPIGQVDLYITTVNYGLVKKSVVVKEGTNPETVIALNEDAAALTETVTVSADPYERTEVNAPSEQTLNKRELQALASVLLGDPLRAAQALPGVATGDDFRSEFSVRGAGFDRVGVYIDGVLTENFVHTLQGGYLDTGSLSIINSDTVDTLSLFSAAFPSKYGNRTAAIVDVTTREGNRVKPTGRIAASLSGLSGVVDGPINGGRGSYLFAGRKSYLGYLVRRINDENEFTNTPPILNFGDFQAKANYDVTSQSQLGFSIIFGGMNFDRNRDRDLLGTNTVFRADSQSLLVNGHWNYTPNSRTFWQTRVFGVRTTFKNINRDESILEEGNRTQYGFRSDLSLTCSKQRVELGAYIRSIGIDSLSQRFFFFGGVFDSRRFEHRSGEAAFYIQDTWTRENLGLSLTAGFRFEHSGASEESIFSPRGAFGWAINKDWTIRAGVGRYHQFPDLELLFGRLGNSGLRAESTTHYNASVERSIGDRTRVLAEVYYRDDRDLFFTLSEPRLTGASVNFSELPFQNSLRGRAKGFELTLQRRSANKLAGWISYAYSHTNMTEDQTGLRFPSDTDQRHTLNVFAGYRFTETWNLSGGLRYGSGPPIPGFFRRIGEDFFLSTQRNQERVPDYNRVDIRLSKAFLFDRWKLTLTGEVINLLNRNNVRYAGFDDFGIDGRVFGRLDQLLPILPSAGVVIEF